MNTKPISFGRHTAAILFASIFASTGFAIFFMAQFSIASRGNIAVMAIGPMMWLVTLFNSLATSGLFFTFAWPILRKSGAKGQGISISWGTLTFLVATLALYSFGGHGSVKRGEALTALIMGAAVGWAYWWWACPNLRTIFRSRAAIDKKQLALPL